MTRKAALRCIPIFLALTGACVTAKDSGVKARTARLPAVTVQLSSADDFRELTLGEFESLLRGCRFFGGNPLTLLRSPAARSSLVEIPSSYGASCRGPDAIAPEVEVKMEFEDKDHAILYVTPDFSDEIAKNFVLALRARDARAVSALVDEKASVSITSHEAGLGGAQTGDIAEGQDRKILTDYIAAVERSYGPTAMPGATRCASPTLASTPSSSIARSSSEDP